MKNMDIVSSLMESRQYSMICEDTLVRVCEQIAPRYSKHKDALKAVKAHLHAICGAFLNIPDLNKANALLDKLETAGTAGMTPEDERCLMAELMKRHVSTAERLPLLPVFYSDLFSFFGKPCSVADIGCGLNPLCISFMELDNGFCYRAADINLQCIGLVSRYFEFLRESRAADVLCEPFDLLGRLPEWPRCDMAFVFKLLPLMEQQRHGSARLLLDALNADVIAVTFPTVTIGGKRKGMSVFYSEYFQNLIKDDYSILYRKEYATELVFGIKRT